MPAKTGQLWLLLVIQSSEPGCSGSAIEELQDEEGWKKSAEFRRIWNRL